MPRLTLGLLGPVEVALDGEPVTGLAYEKVRALLAYLAVESDRPHHRDTLAALLPPLTLQTLVENALKHGLRALAEGGVVQIQALVRDGWLHLAVRNPVPAEPSREPGLGQGLRHLRERLAAQYRDRARVSWVTTPEGFAVEISLPFETQT